MRDPDQIIDEEQLEDLLSEPYPEDVEFGSKLDGDILVLGAGGKMGPTLVQRMVRSTDGVKVYAVSRFSDPRHKHNLDRCGAIAISADLLGEAGLAALPDCPNVIYMVGMKFGASGEEDLTWIMNTYLAGRAAERFKSSRIVAFSTGNVYPFVSVDSGGSKETDPTGPVGEYAQSCLGRERVLEYFSRLNSTPVCILRLNYAVEPRYGVLLDIATKVYRGEPVPIEMGYVNVIWQGDANSVCLRSLGLCKSPAEILNVAGKETLSVRSLAEKFAQRFGCQAHFEGKESDTALLSNASRCHQLFRVPRVSVDELLDLIARWVKKGGPTLGKPTKFEVRNGKF